MEEEKYQKELFEFEKPKKIFPRFANIFSRSELEKSFSVVLTLDKIILIAIGMIMLMVIIYALGVESGRSISKSRVTLPAVSRPASATNNIMPAATVKTQQVVAANPSPQNHTMPIAQKSAVPVVKNVGQAAALSPKAANAIAPRPGVQEKAPLAQTPIQVASDASKPYTIVTAAFSRKEWAMSEVDRLKREGLDAFIIQSPPYVLVCVGSYSSKESAKATLSRIKRIRGDAYIKLR